MHILNSKLFLIFFMRSMERKYYLELLNIMCLFLLVDGTLSPLCFMEDSLHMVLLFGLDVTSPIKHFLDVLSILYPCIDL